MLNHAHVHEDGSAGSPGVAGRRSRVGAGSESRGSLGDLKIVSGLAVMLAADAVSTETVN